MPLQSRYTITLAMMSVRVTGGIERNTGRSAAFARRGGPSVVDPVTSGICAMLAAGTRRACKAENESEDRCAPCARRAARWRGRRMVLARAARAGAERRAQAA